MYNKGELVWWGCVQLWTGSADDVCSQRQEEGFVVPHQVWREHVSNSSGSQPRSFQHLGGMCECPGGSDSTWTPFSSPHQLYHTFSFQVHVNAKTHSDTVTWATSVIMGQMQPQEMILGQQVKNTSTCSYTDQPATHSELNLWALSTGCCYSLLSENFLQLFYSKSVEGRQDLFRLYKGCCFFSPVMSLVCLVGNNFSLISNLYSLSELTSLSQTNKRTSY